VACPDRVRAEGGELLPGESVALRGVTAAWRPLTSRVILGRRIGRFLFVARSPGVPRVPLLSTSTLVLRPASATLPKGSRTLIAASAEWLTRHDFTLTRGPHGTCDRQRRTITIAPGLSGKEERKTLLHEMCHAAPGCERRGKKFLHQLSRLAAAGEAWAAGERDGYANTQNQLRLNGTTLREEIVDLIYGSSD
jgi:hypothetical protein